MTRAVLIERLGPPEAFVERAVPLPDIGPDDVHLRIEACGVNFADLMMRVGLYGTVPPRPFSPGFEVAGTVIKVGEEVENFRPGDRAVGLLRYGGYANDTVVPESQLFPCPDSLSSVEAAAIPVTFMTAWVCLFEAARARKGETVLILGASGGVGTAAVQLAVNAGLRVIGTAGTEQKRAFVTDELGAEACFDSRGEWAPDILNLAGERGIDIALDPVGGSATKACRNLLGPLGRLVFYGMSQALPGRRRRWFSATRAWLKTERFHPAHLVEPNIGIWGVHLLHLGRKEREVLMPVAAEIFRQVQDGDIRPIIDSVFPLNREGAIGAHTHLHERANIGKVVLALEPNNT